MSFLFNNNHNIVFAYRRKAKLNIRKILSFVACALPLSALGQVPVNKDSLDQATDKTMPVAYDRIVKAHNTSSIASISGEELRKFHTATLSNALIGTLTGLTVLHNGGAPGWDDPRINIRGRHTTMNNGLLILVDGIQINSLSHITVDEIESVSVLKDAAALAMYGVRGGNGVLLVTTKRGVNTQKIDIAFNARYGNQSPISLPKVANSYDYARLYNEARVNDGLQPLYSQQALDGYRTGSDPYLYPNVNWYDQVLRKNSPMMDYSLTFKGGLNNAKYFVMVGFMDNQGLYAGTDQERNSNINFKRINFRTNVDLQITKGLSAQMGLGGNIQDRKFPPIATETFWQNMASYAPNAYPVRTPDGRLTGTATFPNNPVGYLLEKGYQSRHDRNIQSNVKLTQQLGFITRGLEVFGAVLFDNEFNSRYDKVKNYAYFEPEPTLTTDGQPAVKFTKQVGLDTDISINTGSNYENNRTIFRGGFDYHRNFNQHGWNAMLMYQHDRYDIINNQSEFAMVNLAGRLNYNFKEKYFAEAVFSYSGIEAYAPGKRFGFFPAISGGWMIHKENFWKENDIVNSLKLKASAGLVGNDKGSPRFSYTQYWSPTTNAYYFGTSVTGYTALIQQALANPDLTWEKSMILNFGIESNLFSNKLNLSAEVFRENRTDIFVDLDNAVPSFGGFANSGTGNMGRIINYGTEVAAMFKDKVGDFDYFVGGQLSFARNRIKENYDAPRKEAYASRINRPIGQYFGLEAIGYFENETDINASPVHTFSTVRPGDLKYKDQNQDGVIDVNDEIAIGRHDYPELIFSLNTGLGYKGFNLNLFFQGFANRSVNLNNYMFQPFFNQSNVNQWIVDGRWTPETHATATFPRLSTQANSGTNNFRASNFWIRDANLIRLRNVELGYSFDNTLVRKLGVQGLKVFVSGLNLLSWDDLNVDVDPETLNVAYPVIKTYTAGISVKF